MNKLFFIRHGMTAGNREQKYIGSTDEPLCPEGILQLEKLQLPAIDILFSSPLRRCLETARILCPGQEPVIVEDFKEKDFGRYEGLSYKDLAADKEYQRFLESNGRLPFPAGEDSIAFKERTTRAFCQCITQLFLQPSGRTGVFILHGGTIMAIFEKFAIPQKDFYAWQVANGSGYRCILNDNYQLQVEETL